MQTVTSKDGTQIAYDCAGAGPAIILVDGALCRRAFGPMPKIAALLSQRFRVVTYDRRARGDSGDTAPYAPAREVEDIEALIRAVGGSAALFGASSGAALVMHAAASGLPVTRIALFEPPFVSEGSSGIEPDHVAKLRALVAHDRRGAAVRYFMRDMVGVPAPVVAIMHLMFPVWSKLKAVAHTLPYDATIMGNWRVPVDLAATIRVPTLVMHGSKTDERLKRAALATAAVIPAAQHRELPGQDHNAAATAIAPVIGEFFGANATTGSVSAQGTALA